MAKKETANKKQEQEKENESSFAVRRVPNSVHAQFKRIQAKMVLAHGDKLTAPEALALIFNKAEEAEKGISLKEGQVIVEQEELAELTKQNETLTAQLLEIQNGNTTANAELAEQVQNLTIHNKNLTAKLGKLETNQLTLNDDEFVCELTPEVTEMARKLRSFLIKDKKIKVGEDELYPVVLANYCIKKVLSNDYDHILNR